MTISFRQGPFSIGFLEETVGQCRYLRFFPGEKEPSTLSMLFRVYDIGEEKLKELGAEFLRKATEIAKTLGHDLLIQVSDRILYERMYVTVRNGAEWTGLTEDQMREATKVEAALLKIGEELGLTPDVDPDAEKLAWIPE